MNISCYSSARHVAEPALTYKEKEADQVCNVTRMLSVSAKYEWESRLLFIFVLFLVCNPVPR